MNAFARTLIAISLIACSAVASANRCQKYWDEYRSYKEAAKNTGGPGAAIAMGAASFFLPVVGTIAAGAIAAGSAAQMDKVAEKNKRLYEECLRNLDKESDRQAKKRREARRKAERVDI